MGIITVDNFDSSFADLDDRVTKGFKFRKTDQYYFHSTAQVKEQLHITLAQYIGEHGSIFSLSDKKHEDSDVIIAISKLADKKYHAQTGNYVGKFTWKGLEIDIRSRFSNAFMMRMLNVANDVFLDDVSAFDAAESKDLDFSKFIIYYMFVQKLEKAFLMGLPKAYRTILHHEMKVKGRIDINRFIKRDIPFQGKVSSVSREQKEIQEIIDVLFKAVQVIEKSGSSLLSNIKHIKNHLKQHKSSQYVSSVIIQKAMNSKALNNPIFTPYKSVLEYAKLIIEGSNLEEINKGKEKTFGFLVNVADLFELYVSKLLQKEFPDWDVASPQELLYSEQFYYRKIIPDIVMKHRESSRLMVFDTKYKRMLMRGTDKNVWDVDRNDFFQINTYMNFYHNQNQYNLMAGGLLYPMEGEFNKDECHCDSWLGNNAVKFVVDGIDLHGIEYDPSDKEAEKKAMADIVNRREPEFIRRVKVMSVDAAHMT